MRFKTFTTYLCYVIRHKYYVYKAGIKIGVNRWQLLKHDCTKLLPSEFIPYAIWFGERPTTITARAIAENKFNVAWLHHIHSNPHHWQHWILRYDVPDTNKGQIEVLRMPEQFVRELVADWIGVGFTLGKGPENAKTWYKEHRDTMALHPQTRNRIEALLQIVEPYKNSALVNQPIFREIGS